MVGYNAQRNVRLFRCFHTDGYFADLEHYVSYCIDFEQVAHALHYACQTLEAHARVDVGMRKPCIVTLTVAVKLRGIQGSKTPYSGRSRSQACIRGCRSRIRALCRNGFPSRGRTDLHHAPRSCPVCRALPIRSAGKPTSLCQISNASSSSVYIVTQSLSTGIFSHSVIYSHAHVIASRLK